MELGKDFLEPRTAFCYQTFARSFSFFDIVKKDCEKSRINLLRTVFFFTLKIVTEIKNMRRRIWKRYIRKRRNIRNPSRRIYLAHFFLSWFFSININTILFLLFNSLFLLVFKYISLILDQRNIRYIHTNNTQLKNSIKRKEDGISMEKRAK